ncbi:MAG: DUF4405 domain-containing protein [Terrimicrobiaceae bacterium]|nr:DUF4405 domain-containing protein [Terrimicrobiaceae bacterium]
MKSLSLRVLNLALWLVFCLLCSTGALLAFRLPPGSRGGAGLRTLGWGRHDWGELHTWTAWVFLALIVVHLGIHWRWFWQAAAKRRAWPLVAGLLAGILIVAAAWALPIASRGDGEHHAAREHGEH